MKKVIGFILVILLSIAAIRPLIQTGYFPMHDDTQVARVVVMGNALKEGQFPVRIVSDLGYGYGYPIFNFYGPLPYYVGGGLYALGTDSVTSTKIMFAIGMVIAAITMYIFVSFLFGGFAGILASTLFMYAPYHAVQVYVRGSVGEYWAIAFVPLLLYALMKGIRETHAKKGIVIGAIALACTIISHTILGFLTAALFGMGMIVYWIIRLAQKRITKKEILVPIAIAAFGLALSAFFWIPAMTELSASSVTQMVQGAKTSFFDHFICPIQLINSPWGFAGSAPGCTDGMSFKLGKVQVLLAGLSILLAIIASKKKRVQKTNGLFWTAVILTGTVTAATLAVSQPFWRAVPVTAFIQYPWRLLSYSMLFLAVCGAYAVYVNRIPVIRMIMAIGFSVLVVSVSSEMFHPQYVYQRDSRLFEEPSELRFTKSRISDEYLPFGIMKPTNVTEISTTTAFQADNAFLVKNLIETDTKMHAELESTTAQVITIKKAWFPGWKIYVNGTSVTPQDDHGFYAVNIQQGKSIIEMQFANTPVRIFGNIVSILGLLAVGAVYFYGKKTNA